MTEDRVSGMRLRRANSTSRAEDIVTEDAKIRRAQPDKPIHRPRDSIFSWTSGFQNYEGMMNWCFLLLLMGGVRLFLENLNKYGVRVNPSDWVAAFLGDSLNTGYMEFPTAYLLFYTNVSILFTLLVEKLLARDIIEWRIGCFLHLTNLFLMLFIPIIVINVKSEHIGVVFRFLLCSTYLILGAKMTSYIQVNKWCREYVLDILNNSDGSITGQEASGRKRRNTGNDQCKEDGGLRDITGRKVSESEVKPVQWPDNLYVWDIYYFWLAPTLCYELNFPRTSRIRKLFLLRRCLEVIIGTNVTLALVQQWIIPSVVNSLIPFSNMDVIHATERLLKLSIPNHLLWLTWFYLLFHSFLNTSGEILQFGDRDFYHDWWNATDISRFWQSWNLPVHRWCVRHLYKPLLQAGCTKNTAMLCVFFTSAFFHEYLVSVPLRIFKIWAFLGMMAQAPLLGLSHTVKRHFGPRMGNIVVWLSLILGQPLAVMMYYHDFVVQHYGEDLIGAYGKLPMRGGNATVAL